jgi:TrmH family RNA methyltransferase
MIITSFANAKVKFIRKLEHKKFRQETGAFFIEGLRIVGEAIQTRAPIESLVIAPELLVSGFGQSLIDDPSIKNVEKIEVSSEIYQKLAHKDGPQGIGAIVRQHWTPLENLQVKRNDLWVTLNAVADPGNLGTIMRTADAVGAQGVILLGNSTDPFDPSAVKASMGAIFSLALSQSDWESFLSWQTTNTIMMVGTSDRASEDYQKIKYQRPIVLLMGSERHGLTQEMMSACDQVARIPMEGRSDSLNLAIATAVMLYEIYNQSRNLVTIEP